MTAPTPFRAGSQAAKRGALARFFRIGAKSTAQQALVNLLAQTPISEITPEVVSGVLESHKVTGGSARALLKDLWRSAIAEFVNSLVTM
jgi:hypothetical protein